jgi:hypothetical protein
LNHPRDTSRYLEGNGVALVRERALAATVQRALERLYLLDSVAPVDAFVREAEAGERETLLVRESDDGDVEIALRLPPLEARDVDLATGRGLDGYCQIIEGVSHFVYVTQRATRERGTTQLELELQAEVDKYVLLMAAAGAPNAALSATLRERLFGGDGYEHGPESERGARYRLANDAAHRFAQRIETSYVRPRRIRELHRELRAFFHSGQEEKLRRAWGR